MKCPILLGAFIEGPGRITGPTGDCQKDECAWWAHDPGFCALLLATLELRLLRQALQAIATHMPKQQQFVER